VNSNVYSIFALSLNAVEQHVVIFIKLNCFVIIKLRTSGSYESGAK